MKVNGAAILINHFNAGCDFDGGEKYNNAICETIAIANVVQNSCGKRSANVSEMQIHG